MIRLPTNPSAVHASCNPSAIVAIVPKTFDLGGFFIDVHLLGPHTITIKCADADDQAQRIADIEKAVG